MIELTPLTSSGCFFLDTNIVLSEILQENDPRIQKLKQDSELHGIFCYISNSVKEETNLKVEKTIDFLGNIVREAIKYSLEESRERRKVSLDSPINAEDVKALENLFWLLNRSVRASRVSLRNPTDLVEEWTVTFLGEKLNRGEQIDIPHFLVELTANILATTSSIQDPYDEIVELERGFLRIKETVPNEAIITALHSIGIHDPDDVHIASAFSYQTESREKSVFATLDYDSILSKRDQIRNQLHIDIECCDPLYALYHLS